MSQSKKAVAVGYDDSTADSELEETIQQGN